ncbi:MAG: type 1 glutamine amidotransferase [Lactobacillus sp.]|nr:MAG: type 1 glutamine amidotransferase [Lactobacillus sp.]
MQINVLQHTPNEGPGAIALWAQQHQHQLYIYHPYQFGVLPTVTETEMLVILGGPQSVNDDLPWISAERRLIKELLQRNVPIFGVCFGAQQLAKVFGSQITLAPVKEVGWAPVYLQDKALVQLPEKMTVLHWHQETFSLPVGAQRLFTSDLVLEQGFWCQQNVIGLQFHLETLASNVREIVINDGQYTQGSQLAQTPQMILAQPIPAENQQVLFQLLDLIN